MLEIICCYNTECLYKARNFYNYKVKPEARGRQGGKLKQSIMQEVCDGDVKFLTRVYYPPFCIETRTHKKPEFLKMYQTHILVHKSVTWKQEWKKRDPDSLSHSTPRLLFYFYASLNNSFFFGLLEAYILWEDDEKRDEKILELSFLDFHVQNIYSGILFPSYCWTRKTLNRISHETSRWSENLKFEKF